MYIVLRFYTLSFRINSFLFDDCASTFPFSRDLILFLCIRDYYSFFSFVCVREANCFILADNLSIEFFYYQFHAWWTLRWARGCISTSSRSFPRFIRTSSDKSYTPISTRSPSVFDRSQYPRVTDRSCRTRSAE